MNTDRVKPMADDLARRAAGIVATLSFLGCLAACAVTPGESPVVGHELRDVQAAVRGGGSARRIVVAVALGGGGLRGYAHIGVLQALEDAGIHPDIVVGSSIGAIVGAAYASGTSPSRLWALASTAPVLPLADVTLRGPGFIRGDALARWMNELVEQRPIEHLPTPFAAVASDLERSAPIVITSGDAGQAVRASAAIPGIFLPVKYAGGELVDGGVVSLVPVRAARALGADIVIGVDICCHGARYASSSAWPVVLRASQTESCLLARAELAGAEVVIAPPVSPAAINDAASREQVRRLGYVAAGDALPALRAALQRHAGDRGGLDPALALRQGATKALRDDVQAGG